MSNKKLHGKRAFTLLEVLLVTTLLFFLAIATFSSVKSIIATKYEIDYKTEFLQLSRAAIALLDRDIRAAFFVVPEDLGWAPVKPNPNDNPPKPAAIKPVPVSVFVGTAETLFFSSKSHQRMSANSPENEQHFVTYQLQDGKIVRAESKRAVHLSDREDKEKFQQFTLLEGVKTVKFKFWSKQQGKWVDDWDTDKAETKDTLPLAVEVYVEFTPQLPDDGQNRKKKAELVRINTIVKLTEATLKSDRAAIDAAAASVGGTGSTSSSSSSSSDPSAGGTT